MRLRRAAFCVLLVTAAFAPRARAISDDDLTRAKARYSEAARQFDLMEYAYALDGFREAYRLTGDPVLLFNIAQCHRKLGHTQEALTFYKNYLRRKPDAANRDEVERRIRELEKAEAVQPAAVPPVPTADTAREPAASAAIVAPPPVASAAENSPPTPASVDLSAPREPAPEPARTPAYKTWWFWTGTGAVIAGGITAALLLTRKGNGAFCADCNVTSGLATK